MLLIVVILVDVEEVVTLLLHFALKMSQMGNVCYPSRTILYFA